MLSSTSNSNQIDVILGAFVFALLLLVAYHFLIVLRLVPAGEGETAYSTNCSRIENYALAKTTPEKVALGSSELNRAIIQTFDPGMVNLCMIGQGAIDGLSIIALTKRYPKAVLIEADSTLGVRPTNIVEEALPFYKRVLIGLSPVFRTCYKPSGIVLKLCANLFPPAPQPPADPEVIKISKQHWLVDEPDRAGLNSNLTTLKSMVDEMQKQGTVVCFVDIPLDPIIYNGKVEAGSRQIIEEYFPRSQYIWLGPTIKKVWTTVDGLHLTGGDAVAFERDIEHQLYMILHK